MQTTENRFSPSARYRVAIWRGIETGGKVYEEGELLPAGLLTVEQVHALWALGSVRVEEPAASVITDEDPNEPALPSYEESEYGADIPTERAAGPISTKRGRGRPRKYPEIPAA